MKEIVRKVIGPTYLMAGDTMVGRIHHRDGSVTERSIPITKQTAVDTMVFVEAENELGLEEGIGVIFGRASV